MALLGLRCTSLLLALLGVAGFRDEGELLRLDANIGGERSSWSGSACEALGLGTAPAAAHCPGAEEALKKCGWTPASGWFRFRSKKADPLIKKLATEIDCLEGEKTCFVLEIVMKEVERLAAELKKKVSKYTKAAEVIEEKIKEWREAKEVKQHDPQPNNAGVSKWEPPKRVPEKHELVQQVTKLVGELRANPGEVSDDLFNKVVPTYVEYRAYIDEGFRVGDLHPYIKSIRKVDVSRIYLDLVKAVMPLPPFHGTIFRITEGQPGMDGNVSLVVGGDEVVITEMFVGFKAPDTLDPRKMGSFPIAIESKSDGLFRELASNIKEPLGRGLVLGVMGFKCRYVKAASDEDPWHRFEEVL